MAARRPTSWGETRRTIPRYRITTCYRETPVPLPGNDIRRAYSHQLLSPSGAGRSVRRLVLVRLGTDDLRRKTGSIRERTHTSSVTVLGGQRAMDFTSRWIRRRTAGSGGGRERCQMTHIRSRWRWHVEAARGTWRRHRTRGRRKLTPSDLCHVCVYGSGCGCGGF